MKKKIERRDRESKEMKIDRNEYGTIGTNHENEKKWFKPKEIKT